MLLLAAVSVGWWVTRPRPPAPAPQSPKTDHGEYNQVIDSLTEHMQKEPCDRASIVKLGEWLLKASDARGALQVSGKFFDKCGEHLRLRWVSYSAHKQLSEFDAAAEDATRLIESEPDDKDYWFWRGQAREIQGDRHSAIRDYQQAIALEPRLQGVPLNLVNLLEQAGQPCEALVALDTYMSVYPELRAEPRLQVRLEKLGGNSKCAGFLGTGKAILPRRASDTAILAPVVVNGKQKGSFILDTGATYVTLTRAFADTLGLDPSQGSRVNVVTGGGMRTVRMGRVESLEVNGVRATNVEVAILDDLPNHVDGLLGLSFLNRFEVKVDATKVQLEQRSLVLGAK
ncbi:aspartyl protease family protein [Cystobacter fuscus]|uniref:aspartyl protease family protein n=1 Tax=Cystobacter fuscus TaxID=43 RepID=UPI0037BEA082